MGVSKELFGKTKEGQEIYKYWLSNSKGMKAGIINYGAILVNLFVPDKEGNTEDIVLGYDHLEDYFTNGSFFGATVGPNANRIGNASFTLNGVKYQLAVNDGANNLHSDYEKGYHKRVYDVTEGTDCVTFAITDADGSMGFPGNKTVQVTYTLTEENELKLHYEAESDKDTIINMTNHSYFNLAGHKAGNMEDTLLEIRASRYTPIVAGAIPTGELAPVAGNAKAEQHLMEQTTQPGRSDRILQKTKSSLPWFTGMTITGYWIIMMEKYVKLLQRWKAPVSVR